MFTEIRSWLFEKLMEWAFDVAPDTANGRKAKYLMGSYFDIFRKDHA